MWRTSFGKKGARRKPVKVPLILPGEEESIFGGRGWLLSHEDEAEGTRTQIVVHDQLMTEQEVRADERQMFVTRREEDSLVMAAHFPKVSGRTRQIKIAIDLRSLADADARRLGDAIGGNAEQLSEQVLVDFEQLFLNFMIAALPVLRKSAGLLARLNPNARLAKTGSKGTPKSRNDGRKDYVVNVSNGWPLTRPRFALFDVVRLDPAAAQRDVDAGYLVPATDERREYREAVAAHRSKMDADNAAANNRPRVTDAVTFLATTTGRAIRDEIVGAIAGIADQVFPAVAGRPPSRTTEQKDALAIELRQDFNRRKGAYVTRGIRKTADMIYDEMAADGRYGPAKEALSAASIERFLGRKPAGAKRRKK